MENNSDIFILTKADTYNMLSDTNSKMLGYDSFFIVSKPSLYFDVLLNANSSIIGSDNNYIEYQPLISDLTLSSLSGSANLIDLNEDKSKYWYSPSPENTTALSN